MHRLVLLRHGESVWNSENRFTGWTDVDLSPLHSDPRFPALFNEWRTRRADLN